jgi:hypothetical protein
MYGAMRLAELLSNIMCICLFDDMNPVYPGPIAWQYVQINEAEAQKVEDEWTRQGVYGEQALDRR